MLRWPGISGQPTEMSGKSWERLLSCSEIRVANDDDDDDDDDNDNDDNDNDNDDACLRA